MSTITVKDGNAIYYKDWGTGQPIVFSHGWPLTADAWDAQMFFFGQRGYRVIAHDRRGNGRSSQPWEGNEMNTFADDLATLIEALDLKDAVLIGHSTGGGEVARYLGRHGTKRVSKAVLIGAVPPLMLKTDNNPGGLPTSVFDGIRDGVLSDRSQFYKDLSMPFYGYNRPNAKISEGVRENFWLQGMQGSVKSEYDTVKAFSETDFTEDLKKIDIPTLVLHGDDDQIVPNRSIWPHDREACQERKAQSLPRLPARNVSDPCRRHQRRRAGVPENLIETPSRKLQPKRRIAS